MKIQEIVNKNLCIGCGLCLFNKSKPENRIIYDSNGFIIPKDDLEVDVKDYCPGIYLNLKNRNKNKKSNIFGPYIELKVAYSNDQIIRYKAASGGVITTILCELLRKKNIDGVLHVGKGETPIESKYTFSTKVGEIIKNSSSRYAPVSLFIAFKDIISKYNKIAIVGKPCDIAGVSQFLNKYPQYNEKVYCLLSFMCMGTPSIIATNKLVKMLKKDESDNVKEIKYRGNGWPGNASIITDKNKEYSCNYEDSWGKVLGRNLHFRCKICPDGFGSFADISAGDAWFDNGQDPIFEESEGRSLLFIRTKKGEGILKGVENTLTTENFDINKLEIIQKAQIKRKKRVWIFYFVLKIKGFRFLKFKGLNVWMGIFRSSPIFIIKSGLGFIKRMNQNKIK